MAGGLHDYEIPLKLSQSMIPARWFEMATPKQTMELAVSLRSEVRTDGLETVPTKNPMLPQRRLDSNFKIEDVGFFPGQGRLGHISFLYKDQRYRFSGLSDLRDWITANYDSEEATFRYHVMQLTDSDQRKEVAKLAIQYKSVFPVNVLAQYTDPIREQDQKAVQALQQWFELQIQNGTALSSLSMDRWLEDYPDSFQIYRKNAKIFYDLVAAVKAAGKFYLQPQENLPVQWWMVKDGRDVQLHGKISDRALREQKDVGPAMRKALQNKSANIITFKLELNFDGHLKLFYERNENSDQEASARIFLDQSMADGTLEDATFLYHPHEQINFYHSAPSIHALRGLQANPDARGIIVEMEPRFFLIISQQKIPLQTIEFPGFKIVSSKASSPAALLPLKSELRSEVRANILSSARTRARAEVRSGDAGEAQVVREVQTMMTQKVLPEVLRIYRQLQRDPSKLGLIQKLGVQGGYDRNSVQSAADRSISEFVTKLIHEKFPEHTLISEEQTEGHKKEGIVKGYFHVMDEVDGTRGFVDGVLQGPASPDFGQNGFAYGLFKDGRPLLTLFYAPDLFRVPKIGLVFQQHFPPLPGLEGGLFMASFDQDGAFLNGEPIQAAQDFDPAKDESVVHVEPIDKKPYYDSAYLVLGVQAQFQEGEGRIDVSTQRLPHAFSKNLRTQIASASYEFMLLSVSGTRDAEGRLIFEGLVPKFMMRPVPCFWDDTLGGFILMKAGGAANFTDGRSLFPVEVDLARDAKKKWRHESSVGGTRAAVDLFLTKMKMARSEMRTTSSKVNVGSLTLAGQHLAKPQEPKTLNFKPSTSDTRAEVRMTDQALDVKAFELKGIPWPESIKDRKHLSYLNRHSDLWKWMDESGAMKKIVQQAISSAADPEQPVLNMVVLGASTGEEMVSAFYYAALWLTAHGESVAKNKNEDGWRIHIQGVEENAAAVQTARNRIETLRGFIWCYEHPIMKGIVKQAAERTMRGLSPYREILKESLSVHQGLVYSPQLLSQLSPPHVVFVNNLFYLLHGAEAQMLFSGLSRWPHSWMAITQDVSGAVILKLRNHEFSFLDHGPAKDIYILGEPKNVQPRSEMRSAQKKSGRKSFAKAGEAQKYRDQFWKQWWGKMGRYLMRTDVSGMDGWVQELQGQARILRGEGASIVDRIKKRIQPAVGGQAAQFTPSHGHSIAWFPSDEFGENEKSLQMLQKIQAEIQERLGEDDFLPITNKNMRLTLRGLSSDAAEKVSDDALLEAAEKIRGPVESTPVIQGMLVGPFWHREYGFVMIWRPESYDPLLKLQQDVEGALALEHRSRPLHLTLGYYPRAVFTPMKFKSEYAKLSGMPVYHIPVSISSLQVASHEDIGYTQSSRPDQARIMLGLKAISVDEEKEWIVTPAMQEAFTPVRENARQLAEFLKNLSRAAPSSSVYVMYFNGNVGQISFEDWIRTHSLLGSIGSLIFSKTPDAKTFRRMIEVDASMQLLEMLLSDINDETLALYQSAKVLSGGAGLTAEKPVPYEALGAFFPLFAFSPKQDPDGAKWVKFKAAAADVQSIWAATQKSFETFSATTNRSEVREENENSVELEDLIEVVISEVVEIAAGRQEVDVPISFEGESLLTIWVREGKVYGKPDWDYIFDYIHQKDHDAEDRYQLTRIGDAINIHRKNRGNQPEAISAPPRKPTPPSLAKRTEPEALETVSAGRELKREKRSEVRMDGSKFNVGSLRLGGQHLPKPQEPKTLNFKPSTFSARARAEVRKMDLDDAVAKIQIDEKFSVKNRQKIRRRAKNFIQTLFVPGTPYYEKVVESLPQLIIKSSPDSDASTHEQNLIVLAEINALEHELGHHIVDILQISSPFFAEGSTAEFLANQDLDRGVGKAGIEIARQLKRGKLEASDFIHDLTHFWAEGRTAEHYADANSEDYLGGSALGEIFYELANGRRAQAMQMFLEAADSSWLKKTLAINRKSLWLKLFGIEMVGLPMAIGLAAAANGFESFWEAGFFTLALSLTFYLMTSILDREIQQWKQAKFHKEVLPDFHAWLASHGISVAQRSEIRADSSKFNVGSLMLDGQHLTKPQEPQALDFKPATPNARSEVRAGDHEELAQAADPKLETPKQTSGVSRRNFLQSVAALASGLGLGGGAGLKEARPAAEAWGLEDLKALSHLGEIFTGSLQVEERVNYPVGFEAHDLIEALPAAEASLKRLGISGTKLSGLLEKAKTEFGVQVDAIMKAPKNDQWLRAAQNFHIGLKYPKRRQDWWEVKRVVGVSNDHYGLKLDPVAEFEKFVTDGISDEVYAQKIFEGPVTQAIQEASRKARSKLIKEGIRPSTSWQKQSDDFIQGARKLILTGNRTRFEDASSFFKQLNQETRENYVKAAGQRYVERLRRRYGKNVVPSYGASLRPNEKVQEAIRAFTKEAHRDAYKRAVIQQLRERLLTPELRARNEVEFKALEKKISDLSWSHDEIPLPSPLGPSLDEEVNRFAEDIQRGIHRERLDALQQTFKKALPPSRQLPYPGPDFFPDKIQDISDLAFVLAHVTSKAESKISFLMEAKDRNRQMLQIRWDDQRPYSRKRFLDPNEMMQVMGNWSGWRYQQFEYTAERRLLRYEIFIPKNMSAASIERMLNSVSRWIRTPEIVDHPGLVRVDYRWPLIPEMPQSEVQIPPTSLPMDLNNILMEHGVEKIQEVIQKSTIEFPGRPILILIDGHRGKSFLAKALNPNITERTQYDYEGRFKNFGLPLDQGRVIVVNGDGIDKFFRKKLMEPTFRQGELASMNLPERIISADDAWFVSHAGNLQNVLYSDYLEHFMPQLFEQMKARGDQNRVIIFEEAGSFASFSNVLQKAAPETALVIKIAILSSTSESRKIKVFFRLWDSEPKIENGLRSEVRTRGIEILRGGRRGIAASDEMEMIALTDAKGQVLANRKISKHEAHQ